MVNSEGVGIELRGQYNPNLDTITIELPQAKPGEPSVRVKLEVSQGIGPPRVNAFTVSCPATFTIENASGLVKRDVISLSRTLTPEKESRSAGQY